MKNEEIEKAIETINALIEAGVLAVFDQESSSLKTVTDVCRNGKLLQLNVDYEGD